MSEKKQLVFKKPAKKPAPKKAELPELIEKLSVQNKARKAASGALPEDEVAKLTRELELVQMEVEAREKLIKKQQAEITRLALKLKAESASNKAHERAAKAREKEIAQLTAQIARLEEQMQYMKPKVGAKKKIESLK